MIASYIYLAISKFSSPLAGNRKIRNKQRKTSEGNSKNFRRAKNECHIKWKFFLAVVKAIISSATPYKKSCKIENVMKYMN